MSADGMAQFPAGSAQEEWPLPGGRDGDLWLESYHFFGYDGTEGVGFWLNLSSAQWDPALWREVLMIYQPSGEVLVGKAWGKRSGDGPAAASLRSACLEPMRRWTLEFNGALQPIAADSTFAGRIVDGVRLPASLQLEATCTSPPWRLPLGPEPDAWYAQRLNFSGTVRVAGRDTSISGVGFRDHSRGLRDFDMSGGHTLLSVGADETHWLQLMQIREPDTGRVIRHDASMSAGSTVGHVSASSIVECPSSAGAPATAILTLHTDSGDVPIQIEHVTDVALTLAGPNEFLFGAAQDTSDLIAVESVVRVESDLLSGFGLLESSGRSTSRPANVITTGNDS